MKKKFTYALLVLVIILWGAIFYRLLSNEAPIPVPTAMKPAVTPLEEDSLANYELIADYRDPFFEGQEIAAVRQKESQTEDFLPIETPEVYVEPIPVRYGGVIQNSSNNKVIVILNIEGKDVMFTDGETHHEVTFLKNFDSYVQILYHGKIETIYK